MIITKIRLQEEHPMQGVAVSWPLPVCDFNLNSAAGENGYILKDSQGLGPPNLIAVVVGFDNSGIPIMDSIPENRELVFKIGFMPGLGQSYSTLRDELYKFLNRAVTVSLMNDSIIIAQTTGYIRQFDAVHFSKQPEIQIVIECDDGEFSSPTKVNIPLASLNTLKPIINYEDGTAPAGLDLQFKYTAVAAGTGFTISNHSKFWPVGNAPVSNMFQLTYPFVTNDVVTISTHPKNKRITLLRGAITYDLAGFLNAGAVWPKLYSGVNTFDWSFASSWMTWLSASYIPRYWGV